MTSSNDWQPELFGQFEAPSRPSWWARYWRSVPRFLVLRVAYEDLLLTAIAAIMVLVVGFCLGVERGTRLVVALATPAAAHLSTVPAPAVIVPPLAPALPVRPPIVQPRPAAAVAVPTKVADAPSDSRYVVQVASFTARDQADAARSRLSQYGVQVSVVTKGKYHVLYASGFSTYAQATATADRLRPTYRDCFVRKLLAERG